MILKHGFYIKLIFKQIWRNHLSKINKRCTLVGTKTSNKTSRSHNNNHNIECLCFMLTNHHICVVLWYSVRHIGSWNCPKFMPKFKCTLFLEITKYNIVYVLKFIHLGWGALVKSSPLQDWGPILTSLRSCMRQPKCTWYQGGVQC